MARSHLTLTDDETEGYTAEGIADHLDVEPDGVRKVIKAVRELDHKRHPWRDPAKLKPLTNGATAQDLADRWDCSPRLVHRWARRYELHDPEEWPPYFSDWPLADKVAFVTLRYKRPELLDAVAERADIQSVLDRELDTSNARLDKDELAELTLALDAV
jgi:hypothetical protein